MSDLETRLGDVERLASKAHEKAMKAELLHQGSEERLKVIENAVLELDSTDNEPLAAVQAEIIKDREARAMAKALPVYKEFDLKR